MSQKSLTSNPPAAAAVRDIRGARRRLLVAARLSAHALSAKPSHFAEGVLSFLGATSPERKENSWPLPGLPSMSGSSPENKMTAMRTRREIVKAPYAKLIAGDAGWVHALKQAVVSTQNAGSHAGNKRAAWNSTKSAISLR